MNKLLLSKNGRNHIRIVPLKDCVETPEDGAERIRWCEEVFTKLQNSDEAIRHSYYCNRKTGILTGVWELDGKIYLDYCFRTADKGIYVTTVYIYPGDGLNDALSIEKFLRINLSDIGQDYKMQILEGKEAWDETYNNDTGDQASESN